MQRESCPCVFTFIFIIVAALLVPPSRALGGSATAPAEAFPKSSASAEGISQEALDNFVKRAEAAHSDALIVLKNGKLIGEWHFGKPRKCIELMSATKSIVNLAIGRLIETGKIKSLDEPIGTFYPEWNQGRKKQITLRHLLNHTSGLQADVTTEEVYASPDFVKLALAAELVSDPGTKFFYNNKAVNLLAGIVKITSGKRMDEYLKEEIFAPLGISDFTWTLDDSGNPQCMSGLQMQAIDLAKIGQMLADGGVWRDKQVISRKWIEESTAEGQPMQPICGLLWWRVPAEIRRVIDDAKLREWRDAGVDPGMLDRVVALKDKPLSSVAYLDELRTLFGGEPGLQNWIKTLKDHGVTGARTIFGAIVGFTAKGYFGQYLTVLPGDHLVVVRQIDSASHQQNADDFSDYWPCVLALRTTK